MRDVADNIFDLAAPLSLPAEMRAGLIAAYSVPARAYHHIGHVHEVLHHYAVVAEGPGWRQPANVWVAVLYHDAIYHAGRRDNELRSAQLAAQQIHCWLPDADLDVARINALIELTARHGSLRRNDIPVDPHTDDTLHFLDCDMAILGAEPDAFAAYDLAIAEEYRAVPRWIYRRKRRAFFQQLLAAERIFLSDFFHERFEALARHNLQSVLTGR